MQCWHFEAIEDIMTKFKSQGLHIIRNASVSGFPVYLNPTLWNIGILLYKQAKLPIHLQHSVLHAEPRLRISFEMLGKAN